jgi:integrase
MARRISLEPCASGLKKWPWRVNLPANISNSGKRERRFFNSKSEAQTFCRQQRIRLDNFGRNSGMLTPGQQEQAAMAFERLAPYNVTLNSVVVDFIARRQAIAQSITFEELFERFMGSRKSRSEAYLRGLKYTLPRFPGLHGRIVAEIQAQDIEAEMDEMTPAVRNAFLRNLRAVFNFGVKRGWLESNPVSKLDFEKIKNGEVIILSPVETEALMCATEKIDVDLLPYHAIALFAGVRPLELERLEWRHIDLVEGHIEITSAVSKTGRRRIIDIEPNLKAWLNRYIAKGGDTTSKVTPTTNLRSNLREIRAAAGLTEWTQDIMRHSYASYWLAQHGDINRLTLQMGHENADMLWKHYHKASKRKDAAKYWQITPSADVDAKTVSFFHHRALQP